MSSRRDFLSCARHITLAAAVSPAWLRAGWARRTVGTVVAAEPFGRLEAVGDGIWALISTPLSGDYTTVANGGIIAGKNGVLAIEGLMRPAGAKWLAEQAKTLAGKWPTHVVLTHHHGDHVNGLAGYTGDAAFALHVTTSTRERSAKGQPADESRNKALAAAIAIDPATETKLDLGGRVVRILPRSGHTASDVVIAIDDPKILFAGDLIWNGMFPNYVDSVPSALAKTVRDLRGGNDLLYVPGHGPLGHNADVDRYLAVLDEIERAARAARDKGATAAEGAAQYVLPPSLGGWTLFNKRFMETAFDAWYRELGR